MIFFICSKKVKHKTQKKRRSPASVHCVALTNENMALTPLLEMAKNHAVPYCQSNHSCCYFFLRPILQKPKIDPKVCQQAVHERSRPTVSNTFIFSEQFWVKICISLCEMQTQSNRPDVSYKYLRTLLIKKIK